MNRVAVGLLLVAGLTLPQCRRQETQAPATQEARSTTTAARPADTEPRTMPQSPEQPGSPLAASQPAEQSPPPRVVMKTSMGEVVIELYPDKAPVTVKNFLEYVDAGFYDGTIFHRVIPGFMIQGGGFTADRAEKQTRPPISNEARNGLTNARGTIAMARTSDPNSATAQFFINVADNRGLDYPRPDGHGYAVFGKVIEGLEVADRIVRVPTGTQAFQTRQGRQPFTDVPQQTVVIESAKRR